MCSSVCSSVHVHSGLRGTDVPPAAVHNELMQGRMGCKCKWAPTLFPCVSGVWQINGCTPLYAASASGHVEVVRALVGAGAAVNQARVREDWGGCWCSGVRGRLGLYRSGRWQRMVSCRVRLC